MPNRANFHNNESRRVQHQAPQSGEPVHFHASNQASLQGGTAERMSHTSTLSNDGSHLALNTLEDQLRGMIIKNSDASQGQVSSAGHSHVDRQLPDSGLHRGRRHMGNRGRGSVSPRANQSSVGGHHNNLGFSENHSTNQHYRGTYTHRTNPRGPSWRNQNAGAYHSSSPTPNRSHDSYQQTCDTTVPVNSHYEHTRRQHYQRTRPVPTRDASIQYISSMMGEELREADISQPELNERERLRTDMEQVCSDAVTSFEQRTQANFPRESVQLKCYGSLVTTFATQGSDMDLMLLSPLSALAASDSNSELPRVVEKALLDAGYGARLLSRTRVPIIKVCQSPTPELMKLLLENRASWETEIATKETETRLETPVKRKKRAKKLEITQVEDVDTQAAATYNSVDTKNAEHDLAIVAEVAGEASARKEIQTEADDPSHEDKSDDERVKLYALAIKEDWYSPGERVIIRTFTELILNNSSEEVKLPARQALKGLPNILGRYRPARERPLEYPKDGVGVHCDVNFSNVVALQNSHLLRCYSLADQRVRPMILFIKTWTKKRRINSPYESTLSSYGYVLMVLHYLVNVTNPPVLPNLQHHPAIQSDSASMAITEVDGHNVQFLRNEELIHSLAANSNFNRNKEPLEGLIIGFFNYYGSNVAHNFHWMRDCLSLRTVGGIISKESKGWTAAKTEFVEAAAEKMDIRQRYLVAIEDPFETHHNVGRTVGHEGIVAIRDEFRRAARLIQKAAMGAKNVEWLTTPAEVRGNLLFKHFGHKPRRKPQKAEVKETPTES